MRWVNFASLLLLAGVAFFVVVVWLQWPGTSPERPLEVEIEFDLLRAAEERSDGFGGVLAKRAPLPMCRVEVSSCYEHRSDELGCRNPEFYELPRERAGFRIFARVAD